MQVVKGIIKRNQRRAYAMFYDANATLRIIRLINMPPCISGQRFTLTGRFEGPAFRVSRALPHRSRRLAS
ncbi:MAG: hypothetical protein JNM27_07980 [Leptospirales bacterium]|nr:hypothetical protein [Leptospirales bacterium]